MNASSLGKKIAELRKREGLTQFQLAEKLSISNKAVSKWERGDGYPDIILLPELSKIFGVSVDYLLKDNEAGITVAGSVSIDKIDIVDYLPISGVSASVLEKHKSLGGCVPDILITIAKLDRDIPLSAIARIGDDSDGRYFMSELKRFGINISSVVSDKTCTTGVSHNYIESVSGDKVYYYDGGANDNLSPEDIAVNELDCKIFHIGYVLMLDKINRYDAEYGTELAKMLCMIRRRGIKTSINIASKRENQFSKKIVPILKYCNYVIMNEEECCRIGGNLSRNPDGTINEGNIKRNMELLFEYGVKDKVVVHSPQASFLMNSDMSFVKVNGFELPKNFVKSRIGAYTTYSAGCLYGIYKEYDDEKLLEFAMAVAVCSMREIDSVSGVENMNDVLEVLKKLKRI